jgi:hypothetical protein
MGQLPAGAHQYYENGQDGKEAASPQRPLVQPRPVVYLHSNRTHESPPGALYVTMNMFGARPQHNGSSSANVERELLPKEEILRPAMTRITKHLSRPEYLRITAAIVYLALVIALAGLDIDYLFRWNL